MFQVETVDGQTIIRRGVVRYTPAQLAAHLPHWRSLGPMLAERVEAAERLLAELEA